jgi:ketosteroid isomerase-like protein
MKSSILKAVVLIIAVAFSASVAAQNNEELKAKIEKINKEMQQAMLSGNSTAIPIYYDNDAISLPNYSKMAQGIEAIKKSNEAMMASGMKMTKFETTTIMVTSCEDNIAEVGTYNMSFTMEGTPGEMSDVGKYLTIWKQQSDGSLKITFEIWNTDVYPMSGN